MDDDWRARREKYYDFYRKHPHTLKQLVKAGIYPTFKIASRCVQRQRKRKRGINPRVVGTVAMSEVGRDSKVFSSWRPRHLRHEVFLTDWLIDFGTELLSKWMRGIKTNNVYRPDAELDQLYVEFDMGTERKTQVQRQVRAYNGADKPVLWVVHSLDLFEWIQEVADKAVTLMLLKGQQNVFDMNGESVTVADFKQRIGV